MIKLTEGSGRPWWLQPRSLMVHVCCGTLLAASGCTTMRAVEPHAESGMATVEPGETVLVSLRDGREVELVFRDWTSEGLTGTDETGILQKFENEDIEEVEVERHSVLGSVGVVVLILGVAAAAASGGSSGY